MKNPREILEWIMQRGISQSEHLRYKEVIDKDINSALAQLEECYKPKPVAPLLCDSCHKYAYGKVNPPEPIDEK